MDEGIWSSNSRVSFDVPDMSFESPVEIPASLTRPEKPDRPLPEDLANLRGELLANIQAMLDAQKESLHAAFANSSQTPRQVHSVWERSPSRKQSRMTTPSHEHLTDQLDRAAGTVLPTNMQATRSEKCREKSTAPDKQRACSEKSTASDVQEPNSHVGLARTNSADEMEHPRVGARLSVADKSSLRRRMFATLNDSNAQVAFRNNLLGTIEDLEEAIRDSTDVGHTASSSEAEPDHDHPVKMDSRAWKQAGDKFGNEGAFNFSKKQEVNMHLDEEVYDVANFYKESGCFQRMARSDLFQNITLAVICANAVYIGVDADWNTAETPMEMEWPYLLCENIFCIFFVSELTIRFGAFKRKKDCLKDSWFKFDTCLVILMVFETWITPVLLILMESGGGLPTAPLRMLRLLRLSRMTRLMRALPELVTMVRGMWVASRAVGSSLLMLAMLIYVFAIIMHMLLKDEESVHEYFRTVTVCMWTLLMDGALMDSTGNVLGSLLDLVQFNTILAVCIFMMFTLLSSMTVMNMLIGVLCEVVSAVGAQEKEEASIRLMKSTILIELKKFDDDGNGKISQEELHDVITDRHALGVFRSLQVDVGYLRELQTMLFPEPDAEVSIESIMDLILMCRGDLQPTVKHVISGQAFTRWMISNALKTQHQLLEDQLEEMSMQLQSLRAEQATNGSTAPELYASNSLEL